MSAIQRMLEARINKKISSDSVEAKPIIVATPTNPIPEEEARKIIESGKLLSYSVKNKHLLAVNAPHSALGLKLNERVAMTKKTDTVEAICSYTGIVIEMRLPAIQGAVLEYVSPLSYFSNVKGIVDQGEKYLQNLEVQILAGLWLTSYRHYELLAERTKQNSSIMNAILRTAGKQILIDSILVSSSLTTRIAQKCPQLTLDYAVHKDASSIGPVIQEYTKIIQSTIWPDKTKVSEIDTVSAYSIVTKLRKSVGLSDVEREFEEELINNKRVAKAILEELEEQMVIPTAFITLLKTAIRGKNLVALDDSLRVKLVDKLKSYQNLGCTDLAKIIEDSKNPYDIFSSVDSALDRASDHFDSAINATKRKLSLKEILDAKKAALAKASNSIKEVDEERDLAHEADMEELRREQLEADCGGDMADEIGDDYDNTDYLPDVDMDDLGDDIIPGINDSEDF